MNNADRAPGRETTDRIPAAGEPCRLPDLPPHTCTGCRHLVVRLLSPDGRRLHHACHLYRHATGKCADWGHK